jgi:hypothetical protein
MIKNLEYTDDATAEKELPKVISEYGNGNLSRSFGHGPAIIVVEVPDEAEPVETVEEAL